MYSKFLATTFMYIQVDMTHCLSMKYKSLKMSKFISEDLFVWQWFKKRQCSVELFSPLKIWKSKIENIISFKLLLLSGGLTPPPKKYAFFCLNSLPGVN